MRTKRRSDRGERPIEADAERVEIPSREQLLEILRQAGSPMELEAIAAASGHATEAERRAMRNRLQAMHRDGQVLRNRRSGYGLVDKMDLVRGRVQGHRDGYGFLIPDDGGDDLFLAARQMRLVMHGDRAVARLDRVDRQGRRSGVIVEVLERNTQQVVGRFWPERGIGFVRPDNPRLQHDVLIPADASADAPPGAMVVVAIEQPPSKHAQPIGRVIEILDRQANSETNSEAGSGAKPSLTIDIAIRTHGLPEAFPDAALAEAAAFDAEVSASVSAQRLDLRETPLVTIDGEDARDFDDAVFCEPTANGWRLLVAIADVAHYVQPGSHLDLDAHLRGTSVYFPGRVLPMLPEALSNGLCSLNPEVDRLCMVGEMRIAPDGRVTRSTFHEGVMRSHARLTYTQVARAIIDQDASTRRCLRGVLQPLENLFSLYQVLRASRETRGALDLDSVESRIVFGPNGDVTAIEPQSRNEAHRLIEECMIAANVSAARFLARRQLPCLYRVHDGPTAEKLEELRAFLGALDLRLPGGGEPKPRHYASLIARSAGSPKASLIQQVVLRSLAQAVYRPINGGHFGLALPAYAHFTSPIRRYPDLLVHRAIKHALLTGTKTEAGRSLPGAEAMRLLGEHTSSTERRADDATREVVHRMKCEFMRDRVGEVFEGRITGVAPFGLFVGLASVFVDGLVHVSTLGSDYFHYDPVQHHLVGERSQQTYKLADPLSVRVVAVDMEQYRIELELADLPAATHKRRAQERPRGGGALRRTNRGARRGTRR